jgi:PAS domain S-box-containing protein
MSEKNKQELLKDLQELRQANNALKSLCNNKSAENEKLSESLQSFEWTLKTKQTAAKDYVPDYGDLSLLNKDGLIKKSINKDQLQDIVSEYLDLLETSAAIYEKNGDYALGIFSSGRCQMMDSASRRLCNTGDNSKALASGKWLCHDSCWKDASLKAMNEGKTAEMACNGGINLYAVPVWANQQIIGAINFGFGSPPKDDAELKKLSKKFKIPLEEVREHSRAYKDRPQFIIDYAKQRIHNSAKYLGYLVERKISDDRLLEIKERYRIISETTTDFAFSCIQEKNGYVIDWIAGAVKKNTGYSVDEIKAKKCWRFMVHPDDDSIFVKHVLSIEPGEESVCELRILVPNGAIRWLSVSTTCLVDTEKNKHKIYGGCEDITVRKLAEKALQDKNNLLERVFDSNFDLIALADLEGKFTLLGKSHKILGYDNDYLIGKNVMEFVHPEDVEFVIKEFTHFLESGEDRMVEYRNKRIDGTYLWFETIGTILKDEKGNPEQILFNTRNITERKQAEEALHKSEASLHAVLHSTADGILAIGKDKKVLYANERFAEFWRIPSDILESGDDSILLLYVINQLSDPEGFLHKVQELYSSDKESFDTIGFQDGRVFERLSRPLLSGSEIAGRVWSFRDVTERKQAEEELRQSEEKHRRLFETMSQGVIYQAADGSIVSANPAAENILGISLNQMQGITSMESRWKMITEEGKNVPGNKHPAMIALRTGKKEGPVTRGIYIPEKDEYVWLSITATPLFKPGEDKPFQVYAVLDEISQKTRSQQLLKESEERFQRMLALIPDMISIHDKDFNIVYSNWKGFAAVDEAKRKHYTKCYKTYRDLDEICPDCRAKEVLRTKNPFHTEAELPDGMWIDLRVIPVVDTNGEVELFAEWVRDITDQKQKEIKEKVLFEIANVTFVSEDLETMVANIKQLLSKLIDTKNFYVALYDEKNDLFSIPYEADEKDQIETWPADKSMTGLVIKKKKAVLFKKHAILRLMEAGEIEQIGTMCEVWLGVPLYSGTDIIGVLAVQDYHNPNTYDKGGVEVLEYVSSQISMAVQRKKFIEELKHAKEQAEESDRLKSAFLANMSHEIRTPMNGILGFADLLKEPGLTSEEQQNYIEIIGKSGKRMLNIINDIVDISKIEAGLMKLHINDSNINEQIEYVYTFFKPEAENKGIKLSFRNTLPAKDAIIQTDREKLFAILTNLVKNALKYTKEGTIELGYQVVETYGRASLQFYVKDTGIGVPKDRQKAIFERFIQADIEDKMAYQGAGLGLSISKAYLEMLGGEIWVESEEGKGSTFYFTLPFNTGMASETIDQQSASSGSNDDIRKLKVLVVEDEEISEMLIDKYIKMFGNEILKAGNGVEAVEICRTNPDIDLILMDIRMPVMGGYEAAEQIREFNREVIIIAQTAYGLTGDREKSLKAGCNDYIAKPFNKTELQEMIQKHFGK